MSYQIGDKIYYPMHGAGIIEKIEEKDVCGKLVTYFCLHMPVGDMSLMIPAECVERTGLRPVVSAETAYSILARIPELSLDMCPNWNKRYRDNMLLLKTGDIEEVARVVKGLLLREHERSLSTGERKMMISSKNILVSELVLATGLCKEEIEQRLKRAIWPDENES